MSSPSDDLEVTVVIPVRNEAESIRSLLAALAEQTRPPNAVILVDGGSADGTPDVIEEWARTHQIGESLRLIRTPAASPGRGRNVGIEKARTEWIALTDAGMRPEPTWLERLIKPVTLRRDLEVVYGNYEPVTDTPLLRAQALAYVAPKQDRSEGRMRGPCLPSSLIRRRVWEEVGGFPDLRASEDLSFMAAVTRKGFRVGWAPDATVWWSLQPSLFDVFRKFRLYSRVNADAGRQWDWHYGIVRVYLLALLFIGVAVRFGPVWLLGLAFMGLLRTQKSIWVRSDPRSLRAVLNPLSILGVGIIQLTIDVATFIGWAEAHAAGDTAPITQAGPGEGCDVRG